MEHIKFNIYLSSFPVYHAKISSVGTALYDVMCLNHPINMQHLYNTSIPSKAFHSHPTLWSADHLLS
jgi:hypothetical protein